MNAIRRTAVLIGLTVAVVAGSSIPASATFSDSVTAPATTLAAGNVVAPTSLTISSSCTVTTTTTKTVSYTHPGTGVVTQRSSTTTTATASTGTNQQGQTVTTTPGPGPNESTTTTVSKNTDLSVHAWWRASTTTRGVTGYVVNAHITGYAPIVMAETGPTELSTSDVVDADYLAYQPRLSVTTTTSYGWTATTPVSAVLSC